MGGTGAWPVLRRKRLVPIPPPWGPGPKPGPPRRLAYVGRAEEKEKGKVHTGRGKREAHPAQHAADYYTANERAHESKQESEQHCARNQARLKL